jgi:hypothetical protein
MGFASVGSNYSSISFGFETIETVGEAIPATVVALLSCPVHGSRFLFLILQQALLLYGASLDPYSNATSFFVILNDTKASK